jgi:DNA polymerase elongation subunit (family B)
MYQNIYTELADFKTNTYNVYLWDDVAGLVKSTYRPYAYKKNPLGKYKSIFGDKLDKVFSGFSYGEKDFLETDVPAITRVLIDCYGDSDEMSKNHRVLFFDIETETAGGFPKIDIAQQPITAIAMYDFNTKKYLCYVLDPSGINESFETVDRIVEVFQTESELLEAFVKKFRELDPTIISGWNIKGFDVPYLINRIIRVLGEAWVKRLSPICIIKKDDKRGDITIAGVSILDYLDLYKKFTVGVIRLPNYRLDTVAYEELKENKITFDGSIGDLMRNDFKKFIDYNIRDVYLVVGIDNKNKFIELARALSHVGHIRYEDFAVSSRLLEGAFLTYLRRNGLVAPNKPSEDSNADSLYEKEHEEGWVEDQNEDEDVDEDEGFEGAYVKEPKAGRYDWVFSCDINSLYPSTIMSLNISPETLMGQVSKWSSRKYSRKEISSVEFHNFITGEKTNMSLQEFETYLDEKNYCIASNGAVYNQSEDGFLRTILSKWFAERKEYQKQKISASEKGDKANELFFHLRQMVQKILLNSAYGALGLSSFRFYNLINAEAVTISGQNIIKTSAELVNVIYNKKMNSSDVDYVTYCDTDSLYLSAAPLMKVEGVDSKDHPKAKQYTIDTCKYFASTINSFYNTMMPRMFKVKQHRIRIAEDVICSSALWIAKKRYAMLKVYDMEKGKDVDYKLDAKGIDIVRTSFPVKFKELMEKTIKSILTHKPKREIDDFIVDFKKNMDKLKTSDVAKNGPATFESKITKNRPYVINFNPPERNPFSYVTNSLSNTKAALFYNDMLVDLGLKDIIEPIYAGAKIKWVYLKRNPYGITQIGFKSDGTDPKQILEFIDEYIDREQIFQKELFTKLDDLYTAIGWEIFSENKAKAELFFDFGED